MNNQNDLVVIDHKGLFYTFTRPQNVSYNIFHDKCWFIVKNHTESNVETYAEMYVSWKYNGCEYSDENMTKMRNMEMNLKMKPSNT